MRKLIQEFDRLGCEHSEEFPMKRHTSLRVGGPADLIVYPSTHSELITVLNSIYSSGFAWTVIGGGSNTIVEDEGVEGVVVCTRKLRDVLILENGDVIAECGAVLGTILNKTLKAGLTGFEFAAGIPGTVGGGIYMNAGANGGEIKDVVKEVWIWLQGREIVLPRDEIRFEYRKSHLPEGSVVTKTVFALTKGDTEQSKRNVRSYMKRRAETQPIKMSNVGSIFKNPEEIAAGRLLEDLGFKGFRIGGAEFSEVHANFIVNSSDASASDVKKLIETAQKEALSRRGIKLETEVKIIGKGKN